MSYQLIPEELKIQSGWILYRKLDKKPVKLDGTSENWNQTNYLFHEVISKVNESYGIGLQPKGDLVCIDLDNCFDDERRPIGPAIDILSLGTYSEYSPSGNGLHVWLYSTNTLKSMSISGLEIFANSKYVTVTGRAHNAQPIKTLDIDWIINKYFPTNHNSNNKTEDPHKKKGIIGAFCRAFTIHEALDMTGMYIRIDSDRYKYTPSQSAPGVIVYEDKWVISNHATDPAHGGQHNAFDIVRIHQFGTGADSVQKMCAYAGTLDLVTKQMVYDDFNIVQTWQKKLKTTKHGFLKCSFNLELILKNVFTIKLNTFNERIHLQNVPWSKKNEFLNDNDIAKITSFLDTAYGIRASNAMIMNAIQCVALDNAFHPIKEYFEKLPAWDGVPRVESLLIDCLDAEDSPYTRAVTRKTLAAMYRRIYEPGCKFDYCLTLIGDTGFKKSMFFNDLAQDEYFSDDFNLNDTRDKTGSEKTLDNWLIEIAELSGLKKADKDCVKAFITRKYDKFRPAFGRVNEVHPRSCVFVATSNEDDGVLKDITGGRRWWIVKVNKRYSGFDRDQIWAEVKETLSEEPLYLSDELEKVANMIQSQNIEADDRVSLIEEFINKPIPLDWYDKTLSDRKFYNLDDPDNDWCRRTFITTKEIWNECFKFNLAELNRFQSNLIVACLIKLGYKKDKKTKRMKHYGVSTQYTKSQ